MSSNFLRDFDHTPSSDFQFLISWPIRAHFRLIPHLRVCIGAPAFFSGCAILMPRSLPSFYLGLSASFLIGCCIELVCPPCYLFASSNCIFPRTIYLYLVFCRLYLCWQYYYIHGAFSCCYWSYQQFRLLLYYIRLKSLDFYIDGNFCATNAGQPDPKDFCIAWYQVLIRALKEGMEN